MRKQGIKKFTWGSTGVVNATLGEGPELGLSRPELTLCAGLLVYPGPYNELCGLLVSLLLIRCSPSAWRRRQSNPPWERQPSESSLINLLSQKLLDRNRRRAAASTSMTKRGCRGFE